MIRKFFKNLWEGFIFSLFCCLNIIILIRGTLFTIFELTTLVGFKAIGAFILYLIVLIYNILSMVSIGEKINNIWKENDNDY